MSVEALKLLPLDIHKHWGVIRAALAGSLPPTFSGNAVEALPRIQKALIEDLMQCWVLKQDHEAVTVVITMISGDIMAMEKDLMIYAMYNIGENGASMEALAHGWQVLLRYASGVGCNRLTFYTDQDEIVKLAERASGEEVYVQKYAAVPVNTPELVEVSSEESDNGRRR